MGTRLDPVKRLNLVGTVDRVLLVLPESDARVLTRELLYTGVTRARKRVDLWAGEAALRAALSRRIERASGLRDALWAEGTGNR